jgi:hypothetical protein
MLADHFNGTYYRDEVFANRGSGFSQTISNDFGTEPDPDWLHYNSTSSNSMNGFNLSSASDFTANLNSLVEVKAFASKGENFAVMILNHTANTQTAVLKFSGTSAPTSGPSNAKRFAFDAGLSWGEIVLNGSIGSGASAAIDANSTHVIIFDCQGTVKQRFRYRLSTEAQNYNTDFDNFYNGGTISSITSATTSSGNNCFPNNNCTITVSGASSPYSWYKLPNTSVAGSSSILTTSTTHTISPGIYRTIANGCGTVAVISVIHQNSPLANPGYSVDLCSVTTATLGDPLAPVGSGFGYTWNPTGAWTATATNSPSIIITNTLASSTVFTLNANSGGCQFSSTVSVISGTGGVSLMIKDHPGDNGAEPDVTMNGYAYPWGSSDIWVRNANDNGTTHQNAIMNTTNYIYVKVRNNSCQAAAAGGSLTIYHSKSSTGAQWPISWNNYLCSWITNSCSPAPTGNCGGAVGTITLPAIPPNSTQIFTLAWNTPDNPTCLNMFNSTPGYWCLLAHLDHPNDPLNLGGYPPYTNWQAWSSNNIAQRNIDVVAPGSGSTNIPMNATFIRNISDNQYNRLDFYSEPDINEETLLDYADLTLYLSPQLLRSWSEGGEIGEGIVRLSDTSVLVTDIHAYMDNIFLFTDREEQVALGISSFSTPNLSGGPYFRFTIKQTDPNMAADSPPIGGMSYDIDKDNWYCADCDQTGESLQTLSASRTISNDTLFVDSEVIVPNGKTLQINHTNVKFAEAGSIKVEDGGKLIIMNSLLQSSCKNKSWPGLRVVGTTLASRCLTITGTTFRDCHTPVSALKASGILLMQNAFVGVNGNGTAIQLVKCQDFNVDENHISLFDTGLVTKRTYTSSIGNTVEKNNFQKLGTCISMHKDKHTTTSIQCNKFGYHSYAMLSDSCALRNFGSQNQGAGNRFSGNSSFINNKLNRSNGNSPSYYYNPSTPISNGMNISIQASSGDRVCYSYSFDTSRTSSSRAMPTGLADEVNVEAITLIPNPTSGKVIIRINKLYSESAEIYIRDIQGRILKYYPVRTTGEETLDLSNFDKGLYFVTYENGEGNLKCFKLVRQD